MDLGKELHKLLHKEGLGRKWLLRVTTGSAPIAKTGEGNPEDPRYWGNRSYLDYEVTIYYTNLAVGNIKDPIGLQIVQDEVIYMEAENGLPTPTMEDAIVPLKHDENGNVIETLGTGTKSYLIDESIGIIAIGSVLRYWGDSNGKYVYYALGRRRRRTGERGVA
jgi:hypothetical protein